MLLTRRALLVMGLIAFAAGVVSWTLNEVTDGWAWIVVQILLVGGTVAFGLLQRSSLGQILAAAAVLEAFYLILLIPTVVLILLIT
jgi:hypothetical protein